MMSCKTQQGFSYHPRTSLMTDPLVPPLIITTKQQDWSDLPVKVGQGVEVRMMPVTHGTGSRALSSNLQKPRPPRGFWIGIPFHKEQRSSFCMTQS